MSNQPGQHFLLSSAARSLSLAKVMRMSDDEAFAAMKAIRWASTEGEPFCPKCGCLAVYTYTARRLFKCKACGAQFTTASLGSDLIGSLRDRRPGRG